MARNDARNAIEKLAQRENADLYVYNSPILWSSVERLRAMVCAQKKRRDNAILYLTTLGGDPDAGFRLAACMRRAYASFRVHLFGMCKSAGTLAVIGADDIIYGDFGELGPLDVQMTKPDELYPTSSGLDIFQALAVLKNSAFEAFQDYMVAITESSQGHISAKTSAEIARELAVGLFAPMSSQIEPERLGEMQRAITIATEYGKRLTSNHRDNLKANTLEKLVQGYPGHGFVIDIDEARTLFKKVREADPMERRVASFLPGLRRPTTEPVIANLFNLFSSTGAPRHVTRKPKPAPKRASRGVRPQSATRNAGNVAELRPDATRNSAAAEENTNTGNPGQKPRKRPDQTSGE